MNAKTVEKIVEGTRPRVRKFFTKPSLTRQEFKNECDLGLLLKKFGRTPEGLAAIQTVKDGVSGRFEDVSDIPDYRAALDAVSRANGSFMALPAIVRKRFDNDAALFLDFCTDPKNLPELRALGLANPEVKKEEVKEIPTKV